VEKHSEDPIDDPWDHLGDQFNALRHRLADTYRRQAGDKGPSEDEVKDAFSTLGKAWNRVAGAIGNVVKDEEVRQNVKQAATGFFEALGSAFSDLGAELRRNGPSDEPADGADARPDGQD
jgi:hypothetical protein